MVELDAHYVNLLAAAFTAGVSSGAAAKGVGKGNGLEAIVGTVGTVAFAGAGTKVYCSEKTISASDVFDTDNWKQGTNLLGFAGTLIAYGAGVAAGLVVG